MFFFDEPYSIFTVVGLVIMGLSLIEILLFFFGMSFSKTLEADVDADADFEMESSSGLDIDGDFDTAAIPNIGLFHLKDLPFSIVLLTVGLIFSLSGISLHYFADTMGISITNLLAVPTSVFLSCVGGFYVTKFLSKILPNNETYAVKLEDLVGCEGTVVIGKGDYNSFVQVKIVDKFGNDHYIMTKAAIEGQSFTSGQKIVLMEIYPNKTFGSILKGYGKAEGGKVENEEELEYELGS